MQKSPRGFTIIEMLAVLLIISTLVMLLLPAVQSAREMARRSSCASGLVQLGLAVQGYHAAFDQLPTPLSGTDGSTVPAADNNRRLSIFVALLPFMGDAGRTEAIAYPLDRKVSEPNAGLGWNTLDQGGEEFTAASPTGPELPWVAGGPEPFEARYPPWVGEVPWLRCASDPGIGNFGLGRTNYAVCLGDAVIGSATGPMKEVRGKFVRDPKLADQCDASMRGMFVPRVVMRMRDTTDGLAHTLMLAEIATDLGDLDVRTKPAAGPGGEILRDRPAWGRGSGPLDPDRQPYWQSTNSKLFNTQGWGRGLRWADGMPLYTAFNTILPPNRETVMRGDCDDCWGILPPSSRHQGGVNVCTGDGAVKFITDSIDAGDSAQPTVYLGSPQPPGSPSPYGLWGALGTRASGELHLLPQSP